MKDEKGITLAVLVIMVVVMIIIASIALYSGTEALDGTLLNEFYTQLEIVQERVDDVSATDESYIDENNNVIYIKNAGQNLTTTQKSNLQNILVSQEISIENIDDYRYFTIQNIKDILDLDEIDYNLFINFEDRVIIAEEGITIGNNTYYMLEDTKYFVKNNLSKNEGQINSLTYGIPTQYINNTYKVNISPGNTVGDLEKDGYIKYKKTTTKYWEITTNTEIVLEFDTEYNIKFIDFNNNSIEKIIKIEYKKDEQGNLMKDENEKNIIIVTEVTQESEEL